MTAEITELLKKVRRLEIISNRFANDLFAGQYQSTFRGQGMEFSEVREYQPGDDVRQIDWNVTARSSRPFIKRFVEERELTVLFLVDLSASGLFGSSRSKLETASEVIATLMFSALKSNDKVGMLTFADQVLDYQKPRKGRFHILNLLRRLIGTRPILAPTSLAAALNYAGRVLKRRAVIFLVSDFFAPDVEKELSFLLRRHDLIALRLTDPREMEFPNIGLLRLEDPETGESRVVDTANPKIREEIARSLRKERERVDTMLRRSKTDCLDISTRGDFLGSLRSFFKKRSQR